MNKWKRGLIFIKPKFYLKEIINIKLTAVKKSGSSICCEKVYPPHPENETLQFSTAFQQDFKVALRRIIFPLQFINIHSLMNNIYFLCKVLFKYRNYTIQVFLTFV